MSSTLRSPAFLPHINGIRAIAILGVLFYHLNSKYCPSGYFGVDVFLVISGFFLFRNILKQEEAEHFHYGSYLLNKGIRILPSWFACCLIVTIASITLMLPIDAVYVTNTAAASSIFVADYYADHCYDYFNDKAHLNTLLHLWYLSLTIQLYLIAPLLLMPFMKANRKKWAVSVLFLLGLCCLSFHIFTSSSLLSEEQRDWLLSIIGANSTYYHLIPRFWEFVAGYFLIFLPSLPNRPLARSIIATASLIILLACYFCYETGAASNYLPVLATVALIKYGDSCWITTFLSSRPLQFIGTISFSLYLWHWPVMVLWKYFCFDKISITSEIIMLLLSLILGYFAWRYVENCNKSKNRPPLKSLLKVLGSLFFMCCLALGGRALLSAYDRSASLVLGEGQPGPCDAALLEAFDSTVFSHHPVYCGIDSSIAPSFLLLGDSHALHIYPGLHRACIKHGKRGIAMNSRLVPLWECSGSGNWGKDKEEALLSYLHSHKEIKYVLISLYWVYRLEYGPYTRSSFIVSDKSKYQAALKQTCEKLSEAGLKVILLADTPLFNTKRTPLEQWQIRQRIGLDNSEIISIDIEEHQKQQAEVRYVLNQLLEEKYAHAVIDLSVPLQFQGRYVTRLGTDFLYSDWHHLTQKGSYIVGEYLVHEFSNITDTP